MENSRWNRLDYEEHIWNMSGGGGGWNIWVGGLYGSSNKHVKRSNEKASMRNEVAMDDAQKSQCRRIQGDGFFKVIENALATSPRRIKYVQEDESLSVKSGAKVTLKEPRFTEPIKWQGPAWKLGDFSSWTATVSLCYAWREWTVCPYQNSLTAHRRDA